MKHVVKTIDHENNEDYDIGKTKQVIVGDQLEMYKKLIERDINFSKDPLKVLQLAAKESGVDEGVANDIFTMMKNINLQNVPLTTKSPDVTSALIGQVKNLPERKEITVYIFQGHDIEGSMAAIKGYKAFTVDMEKLQDLTKRKKKKHNAFKIHVLNAGSSQGSLWI